MSALIRVRAKCSSMNQSKAEIKQRKDKENDWNSWVKEKRQRIARLHKIKRRLNKSVEKEGYNSKSVETIEKNENITVSVIEGQRNKDGYTRLEVVLGSSLVIILSIFSFRIHSQFMIQ